MAESTRSNGHVGDDNPEREFETDAALRQLLQSATEIAESQRRLRSLASIGTDLAGRLDLPTLLERVVVEATALVGARYAALGVLDPHGGLQEFVHVGMDPATVESIGHLPEGKGLLGALIEDAHPVRLERLADDVRSVGFPPNHPPMASFLGVPVRVGDEVFGNLYLTESVRGAFTAEDEELAIALASAAGVAIENARLFDDSRYSASWLAALADLTHELIESEAAETGAERLLACVVELSDSDAGSVALADQPGADPEVLVVAGKESSSLPRILSVDWFGGGKDGGDVVRVDGSTSELNAVGSLAHGLLVPFGVVDGGRGVLTLARSRQSTPFRERDADMAQAFARHVGAAIERSRAADDRRRVALLDERARIASDLHDHVIQRLFAAGLNLHAAASSADPETASKVAAQVHEIDGAIAQIRQSIYTLSHSDSDGTGLRSRVLAAVTHFAGQFTQRPTATFAGPVDLLATGSLADDVVAVVTEGMSNAVRHSAAETIDIRISANGGEISVEVTDDGRGMPVSRDHSGLANLSRRAEARGGSFLIEAASPKGTRVTWRVPA